ncbi:MAG: SagB/ThcOx family dehydrogenase [Bacteroidota bacterium]
MNIQKIKQDFRRKDQGLYGTQKITDLLGMLYHENSKLDRFTAREQGETIGYFTDPYIMDRATKPYKKYYGKESLPFDMETLTEEPDEFFEKVTARRSVRQFDKDYKLSFNELQHMLYYSYGVTKSEPTSSGSMQGYRNVSSAGGLYPLEIYVSLFNTHIGAGLYHFNELDNSLISIRNGNHLEEMRKMLIVEPYIDIKSACGVIFVTGMIERQAIKYGERAYRFMMLECGQVGYLMSMVMEHMGLGSCWAGAYMDHDINKYLEIDGNYETVLTPIVFGKKRS